MNQSPVCVRRVLVAIAVGMSLATSSCSSQSTSEQQSAPEPEVAVAVLALANASDCPAGTNLIVGTSGADNLVGTAGADCILGNNGNDTIQGGGGNDYIAGGRGLDQINGGDGNDLLYGEDDDDTIYGDAGNDLLDGRGGIDRLYGGIGNDTIQTGTGTTNTVEGNDGDDIVYGDSGDDTVDLGLGNDWASTAGGKDTIIAGAGNDYVESGTGNDTLDLGDGDDIAITGTNVDNVHGGPGNDQINTGSGDDLAWGDDGDDVLFGDVDKDQLHGNAGRDVIDGGAHGDTLWGDEGDDFIFGGPAGSGTETINGGTGSDACVGTSCELAAPVPTGCTSNAGCTSPATCAVMVGICVQLCADTDGDGTTDCTDGCPADATKVTAGVCGCGVADTDSDSDGTANCNDACPADAAKVAAGVCGCGVSDADSDGDGTANCNDGCPSDATKTAAGICGCGVADTDSDSDGTADCNDACPSDANKIVAGICGCGVSDVDGDDDGTADCNDACPSDAAKIAAGVCGCGVADTDSDSDGTANCNDGCPSDATKVAPGICGCGTADTDSDSDGTANCNDECPSDASKIAAGICGCGVADTDSDSDGTADCNDGCPNNAPKTAPGACGCATVDTDSDSDGTANCNDGCPNDAAKIAAGVCGCGVADTDSDGDGTANCNDECPLDPTLVDDYDFDSDGDGTADCNDECPNNPDATVWDSICGCDSNRGDVDADGTIDCVDVCLFDNDSDGDYVCDSDDQCPGGTDDDWDDNGIPDGCQECVSDYDCNAYECNWGFCNPLGQCDYVPIGSPTEWTNADFETGTLAGFSTFTTEYGAVSADVAPFPTAAPGVISQSARLFAGIAPSSPWTGGGGIYQDIGFHSGDLFVTVNVASYSTANNGDGGQFSLFLDDELIGQYTIGAAVVAGVTYRATITGQVYSLQAGLHRVSLLVTRRHEQDTVASYIDDFTFSGTAVSPRTECGGGVAVCNGSGVCPICLDPNADADGDTVCDSVDQCPGSDDRIDLDYNDFPDGCQECATDVDCDDGDLCTTDSCIATECSFAQLDWGMSCGAGGTCSETGECEQQECEFIGLGAAPAFPSSSEALAVSGDGNTVTGRTYVGSYEGIAQYRAVRWTRTDFGLNLTPFDLALLDPSTSSGRGVAWDGSMIVGATGSELDFSSQGAFREQSGYLDVLSPSSVANAVDVDGWVTVGQDSNGAFRWVQGSSLPESLNLGASSVANAISWSWDQKIVGRNGEGEAFIWTESSVIGLGDFTESGSPNSEAVGISPSGMFVVGTAAGPSNSTHGFLWKPEDPGLYAMNSLGENVVPRAVNNDGTIVGSANGSGYIIDHWRGTGDLNEMLTACG
ncbi:MAG TPA: hypothetical protein VHO25_14015, partial [Polyangiaceae bacterium]|nr:hypothetical protein [Polyangiaceae bacterium]